MGLVYSDTSVQLALSEAAESRDTTKLCSVFDQHKEALRESAGLFVVSDSAFFEQGLPPDKRFGSSGRLVSLLDGQQLFPIVCEGDGPRRMCLRIALDNNLCRYILSFSQGSLPSHLQQSVAEALEFLWPYRNSCNCDLYLRETLAHHDQSRLVPIVRAVCQFQSCDLTTLKNERRFRLVCSEAELEEKVRRYGNLGRDPTWLAHCEVARRQANVAMVVLAATAEVLHRANTPSAQSTLLLETLHNELGLFPRWEILACQRLLMKGPRARFFGPIGSKGADFSNKIKGMAWDLAHIRSTLSDCAHFSRLVVGRPPLVVPYFASFDERLLELLDIFKLNGILYQRVGGHAHCIEIHSLDVLESFSQLLEQTALELLSEDAIAERIARGSENVVIAPDNLLSIADRILGRIP